MPPIHTRLVTIVCKHGKVNRQKQEGPALLLTLKLPGGGGPNGPTFKNIGLWFTGEKSVMLNAYRFSL